MKISINQIKVITGDLEGNTSKIISSIINDSKNNVDISVFPETSISGYMCGSLWDRLDFVKDQLLKLYEIQNTLIKFNEQGAVIVGYVKLEGVKRNGFPKLKNSVAFISKEGISTYDKQLLADLDQHDDKHYFLPGDKTKIFSFRGVKIGIPICEDAWFIDNDRNIPEEMVNMGAELLIVPNQSYFYYGKQRKRFELFSDIARNNHVDVIEVNGVGVGDIVKNIVIFDGGSMIFNKEGDLVSELQQFEEQTKVINLNFLNSSINKIEFSNKPKYQEITESLIFEQKEFFTLNNISKAQVHVSGGIDSAIVAALVSKSMGKENVILITNPSTYNEKTLKYVKHLEHKLGINIFYNYIDNIYNELITSDKLAFGSEPNLDSKTVMQAVLRTVQGLAACHRFNSGIVATANHTEIVLGWANFHDIGSIGVHSIIGDLTKVELFKLAEFLNKEVFKDEVIPCDLYNDKFKPAAELPNADFDNIDYQIQSGICASLIRERKNAKILNYENENKQLNRDYFEQDSYDKTYFEDQVKLAIKLMKRSVYKAAQGAPIVIISPRSRGFSNRECLINFYNK